MNPQILQLAITAAGIAGAGIAAYIGVRVALAEIKRDVDGLKREDDKLSGRLDRLERPYFDKH